MDISIVTNLKDTGILTAMYRAGFLTHKVFHYMEIYKWVHDEVQLRSISYNTAVTEAASKFNKDERTIWRALNAFTTDTSVSVPR
jgi:hypothetical protein